MFRQFKGITYLPSEILFEIVSGFSDNPSVDAIAYREGLNTIRALSQTCRELRSVYLPLLWKRVETCSTSGTAAWHIQVSSALERKSKGLMQSNYLVSYVQVIIVTLTRYQTATILPAFAQCLSVLPNLHTIKVAHAHSKIMSYLKSAFEGKTFPAVRTVSLPSSAHAILRCCPAVEDVTCTVGDGGTLISAIAAGKCNRLTKLSGITPNSYMAKRLAKAAPNLRSIFVRAQLESIKGLVVLQNLNMLGVDFPIMLSVPNKKKERDIYVDAARTVMRGSKYEGEKSIKLTLNLRSEVPAAVALWNCKLWTETEVVIV
jgi:hypothetical protein